jgi:hypothetical protein
MNDTKNMIPHYIDSSSQYQFDGWYTIDNGILFKAVQGSRSVTREVVCNLLHITVYTVAYSPF